MLYERVIAVTTRFSSIGFKNSIILITVMVPLFALFMTYEFRNQSEALRNALTERGIILAQTGAVATEKILEDAIKNGTLTEEQVFDTNYMLIPGTSPTKYHTSYDSYTDENLRVIEDSYLKDKVVVFAVAVDVNGYLPTHNLKYSKAVGGLNFDRTKRIFDDDVGIAAAQNKEPYKFQEYRRDTGEIMWDISAPVFVNGRHWGAFRIGFSIQETNKKVAAVINRMIFEAIFLILVLILLAVYISYRISNRVNRLAEEVNRIAQGDFSLSNLPLDSPDEVGNLSRSLSNMIIKLRDLAKKTSYSARFIDNYTKELLESTENVSGSAEKVTSGMVLVSGTMEKMEESIESVGETSRVVSEELTNAEASSNKFLKNMEESKEAMSVAHKVVKDLEDQVDKVGQFIQVVSILAEQAGLMAKKIVKDASQFCTEGNEMAALALDVQSNAEDAALTTRDVSELFSTVRDYAKRASVTLEGHRSVILEGINVARLSGKSLKTIVTEMQSLAKLTKEILDYSEQLVEGTAAISNDVEAQTELIRRFADIADTLSQLVNELQESLESIKL
ncbi:methyl-accepting chemotaxis protein [Phosphitispora fastidiosa]|uniref:methyl-accepting chemotaxis protein n=1 Tax=Phosphitispora fastidiosa TaxID=2837202 RepID=UPI001E324660|nr:methyl-accepting chemotaxis protein [Phosphitispora fastidiosa]